jgi:hypothetical protein
VTRRDGQQDTVKNVTKIFICSLPLHQEPNLDIEASTLERSFEVLALQNFSTNLGTSPAA